MQQVPARNDRRLCPERRFSFENRYLVSGTHQQQAHPDQSGENSEDCRYHGLLRHLQSRCRVLRPAVQGFLTSRGYRAAIGRAPSVRQLRDDLLVPEVARLHAENYGVYGRRKMHALMRRQGWDIGRDQTERLMRLAGVRGVRKSKRVFTTRSDKTVALPSDLVNRRFTAPGAATALGV